MSALSHRSHRAAPVRATAAAALLATTSMLSGATPTGAQPEGRSVVVTTEVLGSVVGQLVGEVAEVSVIMPSGANPHSYEPSAREAEMMLEADVLVSNGLDLEEALLPVLETAESEGVTWFEAADHVELLALAGEAHDHDEEDAVDEEGADDDAAADESEQRAEDPHFWTDPLAMRDVVAALETVLADAGIEVEIGASSLLTDLESLDAEVATVVSSVPQEDRKFVTGHQSLGYFAARYGFEVIGTVIPGLSTSGEPTAREMEQLISDIRANDVPAVFAEVGTPQSVAQAVASDSGAKLVTLSTSQLPEGGSYQDLIREIATTVSEALAPETR